MRIDIFKSCKHVRESLVFYLPGTVNWCSLFAADAVKVLRNTIVLVFERVMAAFFFKY